MAAFTGLFTLLGLSLLDIVTSYSPSLVLKSSGIDGNVGYQCRKSCYAGIISKEMKFASKLSLLPSVRSDHRTRSTRNWGFCSVDDERANKKVIIVGAGVAGMACAVTLAEKGIPFQILEASDGVGGRIRTDKVDGYLLDRGFQIFLTSYPEAQRLLDYRSAC